MAGTSRSVDVFVAGGGPAGLAAALAARRQGFEVALADRAMPPVDKACGEGIMPDGLAAAHELGLDLNAGAGYDFRGVRFCESGWSAEALFPQGPGRGMKRTDLHMRMAAAAQAAGVRLLWGTDVRGIFGETVYTPAGEIRARWIVGADGARSQVRKWAGLDAGRSGESRYGFRRHFRVAGAQDFMEVHWGLRRQLYLTPVGPDEICAVLISQDASLRLTQALPSFPDAARMLAHAEPVNTERGGVTIPRRLHAVARGNVALVGDASGSVDAITGEGLCLLFQQACAVAGCLAAGDLRGYGAMHRRIGRRPWLMSKLMLMLGARRGLRRTLFRAIDFDERLFARLLTIHVGQFPL